MKHILIVDDSPRIRRSLRRMLEQQPGWVVCGEAGNGCDGIDQAEKLHPDLIVIDLVMPVLNGLDATRMLRLLLPETPIVMLTTFTDPYIEAEALAVGLDAFVDKSECATTPVSSIQELFLSV